VRPFSTLATAAAALGLLATAAPAQAADLPTGRHVLLGRSTGGRPIRATRVGDPGAERKALVVGEIHGNEAAGRRITRALRRRHPRGVDIWVVDSVNPDGHSAGARRNAHGVDLNRNFPFRWQPSSPASGYYGGPRPSSERETRVVKRWILRIEPRVTVWYHQPWGAVLAPCHGRARIQRRYARRVHMPVSCRGAGLHGTATSWQMHRLPRTRAFVVELGSRGVTKRGARRHARAAMLAAAGR
jgi:protein MpaA